MRRPVVPLTLLLPEFGNFLLYPLWVFDINAHLTGKFRPLRCARYSSYLLGYPALDARSLFGHIGSFLHGGIIEPENVALPATDFAFRGHDANGAHRVRGNRN